MPDVALLYKTASIVRPIFVRFNGDLSRGGLLYIHYSGKLSEQLTLFMLFKSTTYGSDCSALHHASK